MDILSTALRPMAATEDEVRTCLNHFRNDKARIGTSLSTARVMKRLAWKPTGLEFDY